MKETCSSEDRRSRLTRFRRRLSLLVLVALMPACGSYKKTTYVAPAVPGGPAGSTTLMQDNFFPYPNSNWSAAQLSGGATDPEALDGGEYVARLQPPASPRATASSAFTRTTTAFNSHEVTIAIDILATAQSNLADVGSVQIENSTTHAILAEADLDASTLMLTFKINGTPSPSILLTADVLYRLTFSVDASDMATWKLGTGTPTTAQAFSPVMVDLALNANWAAGTPVASTSFDFGNALVTTP